LGLHPRAGAPPRTPTRPAVQPSSQLKFFHYSRHRRFDGYKGHVSIDPDSEPIDNVTITPANVADADAVADLLDGKRTRAESGR
jgi:Transposase DDE domain